MATAKAERKIFNDMCKKPLFFLKKRTEIHRVHTQHGEEDQEFEYWSSVDSRISIDTPASNLEENNLNYLLVAIEREVKQFDKDHNEIINPDIVEFSVAVCNLDRCEHAIYVFNSVCDKIPEDTFWFRYLIWSLNHLSWSANSLVKVLGEYVEGARIYVLNCIAKIGHCLSK